MEEELEPLMICISKLENIEKNIKTLEEKVNTMIKYAYTLKDTNEILFKLINLKQDKDGVNS